MSARTPQTRSQTARKTTGSYARTSTASSGGASGKTSSLLDTISDPIIWTVSGTLAVFAVAAYVVSKHHKSILKVPKAVQVSGMIS